VSFFISVSNFNYAGIVTHKIFKKYFQDQRIFALFLRPKDIKKLLMEGYGRENKKNGGNPYYSPLHSSCLNSIKLGF
jgi:hypothetical protein